MTREEAQHILELCRPGNKADLQDPLISEAYALLDQDSELREWFEAQQVLDARISASLDEIEVPADLESSIMAGMRAHANKEASPASADTIVFPQEQDALLGKRSRAWWQSPWTGIAALFAIMMVILSAPKESTDSQSVQLAAGVPPVIQFLSEEIDSLKSWQFDKKSNSADELQSFLASFNAPSPKNLPHCVGNMPTIGCVTFDYGDAKLSMICFKEDGVYHLITADKNSFPDQLPETPQVYELEDKAFRVWVEGEQVKILTIHGCAADMAEFI